MTAVTLRRWSRADDQRLAELYPSADLAGLAADLGRSPRALYARAHLLGLERDHLSRDGEEAVLAFVRDYQARYGRAPNTATIGRGVGLSRQIAWVVLRGLILRQRLGRPLYRFPEEETT